jgi:hypothetical protein
MEDESDKKPAYITEASMENSGLIGELAEKISETPVEAIATLALSLGRMSHIHNFQIDELYEMIKTGYTMQQEINDFIASEKDGEEDDDDDEDGGNDGGDFGAN